MTQVAFSDFALTSLEDTTISERELAMTVLATALALEDQTATKNAIVAVKQIGVDTEEIQQIINVVITMKGQRIQNLTGIQLKPQSNTQSSCCR